MRKVSSGPLLSIDTFHSVQWFWQGTAIALIRLRGCSSWSGLSLSTYARRHIFAWRDPFSVWAWGAKITACLISAFTVPRIIPRFSSLHWRTAVALMRLCSYYLRFHWSHTLWCTNLENSPYVVCGQEGPDHTARSRSLISFFAARLQNHLILQNIFYRWTEKVLIRLCVCVVWSVSPLFAYGINITKTRLYNFNPIKHHFYIVKLGFTGVYIIFLILLKT